LSIHSYSGDIDTAKKFLIAYKGLEQMIQAAEAGLPIDLSQVGIHRLINNQKLVRIDLLMLSGAKIT
jgi:hypothetical protein